MRDPKITELEIVVYEYTQHNLGTDYNGFNLVYDGGQKRLVKSGILRIGTDIGLTGEYPVGSPDRAAQQLRGISHYLKGRNPLERERIYNDLKRGLRHTDRTAISMIDVALWDLAGKMQDLPIWRLLGGYKTRLPAYASTYHGDENGGLSTPEAFADFAERCADLGYPAFKIHGWGNGPIQREVAAVHAVGRRVGDRMDLMIDPACEYETYFWLEDPYKDGGVSIFGNRKLREKIRTPLLMTEHIFGLEQHVDFIVNFGTDFVRTGVYEDGGITGAMKVAHAAEGFGLDVEFHGGGPAHRHCIAAVRNTNYYEMGLVNPKVERTKPPIYPPEYLDELENIDADGCVAVPQGPGLGADLDWDFINAHQVQRMAF